MAKAMMKCWFGWNPGGGVVHGYGLGASRLQRIRDRGLVFNRGDRQSRCQWRLYDGMCGAKSSQHPLRLLVLLVLSHRCQTLTSLLKTRC